MFWHYNEPLVVFWLSVGCIWKFLKLYSSSSFSSWLSTCDPSDEISPFWAIPRYGVAVVNRLSSYQSNTICPPESWSPSRSAPFHFTKHDLLLQTITISSSYVANFIMTLLNIFLTKRQRDIIYNNVCNQNMMLNQRAVMPTGIWQSKAKWQKDSWLQNRYNFNITLEHSLVFNNIAFELITRGLFQ